MRCTFTRKFPINTQRLFRPNGRSDDSNRIILVADYEDGKTAEFSIDRWTLSLGEYAARIIVRERQEKGDLPSGQIRAIRRR